MRNEQPTYRMADRAAGLEMGENNYFQFTAFSKGDFNSAIDFQFCDRVCNTDWSDKEFTMYGQGLVNGLRCRYKSPMVTLHLVRKFADGTKSFDFIDSWR